MYLTSKNLFVVVYCCIFAPLKRTLLRGESPQTIILPQKEKKRPYGGAEGVASDNFLTLKRKKLPVWLHTI